MTGEGNHFTGEQAAKYVLLNKDVVIAEFEVDTVFDTINIIEQFVELPYWFDNIGDFIRNRRAPSRGRILKNCCV